VLPQTGGIFSTQQGLSLLPDGTLATLGPCGVALSTDGGNTWGSWGPELTASDLSSGSFQFAGLIYAPQRRAFYVWQSQCSAALDGGNDITSNDILTVPFGM